MKIEQLIMSHTHHLIILEDAWERAYQTLTSLTLSIDDHTHEHPCLTCEDAWDTGRKEMLMDQIEADIKLHQGHLRLLKNVALTEPAYQTSSALEEW